MKLTELNTEATPRLRGPEALPDVEVDAIRVARLPHPGSSHPAVLAKPPALVFVTHEPRSGHINSRAALRLIVAVMAATLVWVLIDSGTSRTSRGSHQAPTRLTPTEQRIGAADRARAAAIAQARRDHGTDAQWEDTIPALAPPTSAATP